MTRSSDTVCIVGMGQSRNDWMLDGHYDNGAEVWGLNQGQLAFRPEVVRRFTRWFQIHPIDGMMARYQSLGYVEWLQTLTIPVYMAEAYSLIPASEVYPFAKVEAALGSNYFATNTVGYMLGLALLEGFREIRLYGVNMGDGDVGDRYARPSIEFLLGVLHGRGVKVWVPEESALLKANLYAQRIPQPSADVYALMNCLRSFVERMPYGLDRIAVNNMVTATEEFYLQQTGGKARHAIHS